MEYIGIGICVIAVVAICICQAATMPTRQGKSHYGGIETFWNDLTSTQEKAEAVPLQCCFGFFTV